MKDLQTVLDALTLLGSYANLPRDATSVEAEAIAIVRGMMHSEPEVPAVCEWTQDTDFEMGDAYHSSCGELWSFIDGGPKENLVSYCHHCGKPVKLESAPKGAV